MSNERLANATLVVNNLATLVIPNSIKFEDGTGEQSMTTQAAGNTVQTVYADDAETKMSLLSFSLSNTPENIELAKGWKTLKNANAATLSGAGGFTRAFNNMAVTNKVEFNLGADTNIDIVMMGDPAV
jgi:hypothetical protein